MATDKLTAALRKSVLFFALGKVADKQANRSHLVDGSSTPVSAEITGQVGRAIVQVDFKGTLNVGHASTVNSSSAAPPAEILAAVLGEIPAERRVVLLDKLRKSYAKNGGQLDVDADLKAEATVWLSAMKMSRPSPRAGSVSFQVQA